MLTDDEIKRIIEQWRKKEDVRHVHWLLEAPKRRRQELKKLVRWFVPVFAIAAVLAVALMNHPYFAN